MAATTFFYTPAAMRDRPSSPLNPLSGSSSPLTSPTEHYSGRHPVYQPSTASTAFRQRLSYLPAHATRSRRRSGNKESMAASPSDFFAEGTTPVEGAMWRERFSRRMEERERRKRAREQSVARRRNLPSSDAEMNDAEADRRAQEDDEEIFRRLMMVQRRKAHHAQLVSHEVETGGSDPMLPDFWEEDLVALEQEERHLAAYFEEPTVMSPSYPDVGLSRAMQVPPPIATSLFKHEEEQWAVEAAEAEEAELEAEEAEIAQRVEEAYGVGKGSPRKITTGQDRIFSEPDYVENGIVDWEMGTS